MSWVVLDDQFHSHPKVLAAGNAGAGLYARALSYCGAHLTDGFVPAEWAKAAAAGKPSLIRKLTEVQLWNPVAGGYQINDYLEFNPPRDYVLAKRSELSEKRAKAGKLGARKRWQTDSKPHGKPDSKTIANDMATAMANEWPHAPTPTHAPNGSSTVSSNPSLPPVVPGGREDFENGETEPELVFPGLRDMPDTDPDDIPF